MNLFNNEKINEKNNNEYLIFKEDFIPLNKNIDPNDKEVINWCFIYKYLLKNILNNLKEITIDELKIKISIIKKNIKDYQLTKINSPHKEQYTSSQIIDYFTYLLKKKKSNQIEFNNTSSRIKLVDKEKINDNETQESNIKKEKEQKIISQKNVLSKRASSSNKYSFGFGLEQLNTLSKAYENINTNKRLSKNISSFPKSKSSIRISHIYPNNNFNNFYNQNNNINFSKRSEKTSEKTLSSRNKTSYSSKKIISKNKESANENDYYFELKGGGEIKLNSHAFIDENNNNLIFKPYLKQFNNAEKKIDPSFNSEFYSGLFKFQHLYYDSMTKDLNEDQELQRARITCDNILTKFNPSINKESNLINFEKYP